jgi:hypothetical protein
MLFGGSATQCEQGLDTLRKLAHKRYVPAAYFAALHLRLKRKSEAFAWIEKAIDERSNWLNYLNVEPLFDFLRSDKRLRDAARRVALPEPSRSSPQRDSPRPQVTNGAGAASQ